MKKTNEKNITYTANDTHKGGNLIDESNGAQNHFSMGISEYFAEEFGDMGVHDIQEGFYILEGSGYAKVGSEEFPIIKGDSFLVPAGIKHVLKKDKKSKNLKVLWAHGSNESV